MIQFVRNGKFRSLSIRIERYVNGVVTPGDGFPIVESILQGFDGYPTVTEQFLSAMRDTDFDKRVLDFKAFLLNKYSFLTEVDFEGISSGVDEILCVPQNIVSESEVEIDNDTNFILYFDETGSMTNTADKLDTMRRTVLKDKLLKFYNNDQNLYEQKVRLLNFRSERGFQAANHMGIPITGNTIVILIQNEAEGAVVDAYHKRPFSGVPTAPFIEDLSILKTRLDSGSANSWRVMSLHVHGPGTWRTYSDAYKLFMKAVETGTSGFEDPAHNLTSYPQVKFVYDLDEGATPEYYLDVILTNMRAMGYAI